MPSKGFCVIISLKKTDFSKIVTIQVKITVKSIGLEFLLKFLWICQPYFAAENLTENFRMAVLAICLSFSSYLLVPHH